MSDRKSTTCELSERALARLRRECTLVAQEVWVDDDHRVDFVGFKPAISTAYPAAIERGTFVFVEVKSCMADFTSGHGLTFDGDENWLVCPQDLCEQLREELKLPYRTAVICPNKRGALVERVHADTYGDNRKIGVAELLWRMIASSAHVWRTTREICVKNHYCPWCSPYNQKPLAEVDGASGDIALLEDLVVAVDLTAKLPELKLSEDNGIDEAYIPINYCPICGRNLRKDK